LKSGGFYNADVRMQVGKKTNGLTNRQVIPVAFAHSEGSPTERRVRISTG